MLSGTSVGYGKLVSYLFYPQTTYTDYKYYEHLLASLHSQVSASLLSLNFLPNNAIVLINTINTPPSTDRLPG